MHPVKNFSQSSGFFRKPGLSKVTRLKSNLLNNFRSKYRIAAIAGATGLGIIALLLFFSLLGSLFGIKALSSWPGDFFARSYGILSLVIPLYLAFAAFILADPQWRPDRIFILSTSIFPFLTLALGFVFIRDFEIRSQQFAFLDFAGKTGFSFVIVLVTVVESFMLHIIKNLLFRSDSGKSKNRGSGRYFLPTPQPFSPDAAEPTGPETGYSDAGSIDDMSMDTESPELPDYADEYASGDDPEDPEMIEPLDANDYPAEMEPLDENNDEAGALPDDFPEDDAETYPGEDVEKAIEQAEAAASVYSEQHRKKAASNQHNLFKNIRSYKIPLDILNEYPDGEYWIIDQATEMRRLPSSKHWKNLKYRQR